MEIKVNSRVHGEHIILIDDDDYYKVKDHIWHVAPSYKGHALYAKTMINKSGKPTVLKMHRLIMNFPENMVIDHINNNSLDNRKSNLRLCTKRENSLNCIKRVKGTSLYKGVHYEEGRKKYTAQIMVNRKHIFLGRFKTEDQAAMAYNIAALKYFGEFARPNINIMMQKSI